MKAEVFFRVDGHAQIGLGHVIRSIALAQMLSSHFRIIFVSQFLPEDLEEVLSENEFKLLRIKEELDFTEQITENSLVVLDGYNFDSNYQLKIKLKGGILVCIDDLQTGEFLADLIINHVPGVSAEGYSAQVYTQFALGPEHALLRPPFLNEAKKVRVIDKINTVLICFGGSDYNNLTQRTLRIVQEFSVLSRIIVVVGHLYTGDDVLNSTIIDDQRVTVHRGIEGEKMIELLLEAQLAIVPASGILLEAIAAGCIIISGMYISNQQLMYEAFKKTGSFTDAGNFSFEQMDAALKSALERTVSGKKIIDGYSSERLLKKFKLLVLSRNLFLRKARPSDVSIAYNWATDSSIRTFAFRQHEIQWEEHLEWFKSKLEDQNCLYFICELHQEVIGSVRFDIQGTEAVISFLIDPRFHSKGYGVVCLAMSFAKMNEELAVIGLEVHDLVGYVMMNNTPSIKTFLNLGFRKKSVGGKLKFAKRNVWFLQ